MCFHLWSSQNDFKSHLNDWFKDWPSVWLKWPFRSKRRLCPSGPDRTSASPLAYLCSIETTCYLSLNYCLVRPFYTSACSFLYISSHEIRVLLQRRSAIYRKACCRRYRIEPCRGRAWGTVGSPQTVCSVSDSQGIEWRALDSHLRSWLVRWVGAGRA